MKHLKRFSESDDNEKLLKSLQDLSHSLDRLKSYAQYKNRERLHKHYDKTLPDEERSKGIGKLGKDFEHYFDDLTDEGWTYYMNHEPTFYTHLNIRKIIKKDGIEQECENLIDRMSEIRDRMEDEGFQSKFMIFFNGQVQQVQNPDSYRVPLYKFTGVGDKYTSTIRDKGYNPNDYVYADIQFAIV